MLNSQKHFKPAVAAKKQTFRHYAHLQKNPAVIFFGGGPCCFYRCFLGLIDYITFLDIVPGIEDDFFAGL